MSPLDHACRKAVVTSSASAGDEGAPGDAVMFKVAVDWEPPVLPLPGAAFTMTTMAITMAATTAATAASDAVTMMPVRGRLGGPPCSEKPAAKTPYPCCGCGPSDSSYESPW